MLIARFMVRFVRIPVGKRMPITSLSFRIDPVVLCAHFRFSDLDKSVEEDVSYLKAHPLVNDVPISGYNVRYVQFHEC